MEGDTFLVLYHDVLELSLVFCLLPKNLWLWLHHLQYSLSIENALLQEHLWKTVGFVSFLYFHNEVLKKNLNGSSVNLKHPSYLLNI